MRTEVFHGRVMLRIAFQIQSVKCLGIFHHQNEIHYISLELEHKKNLLVGAVIL